jgi:diguanylate cyclase (GGDEF)-like protein
MVLSMHNPMAALSLRTQIATVFTALLVTTAVLLSLLLGDRTRKRIEADASLTLFVMTDNLARIIANDLHQISTEVLVIADASPLWVEGLNSERSRLTVSRLHAMRPDFAWVGMVDTRGIVRQASDGLLRGQDMGQEPWFREGSKGLYVGNVREIPALSSRLPAPNSGEPPRYLDFSAPIRSGERILGVLGVHARWDWLRQVIDVLQPPQSARFQLNFFVFDRQGELIYAPNGLAPKLRAVGQRLPFAPSNTDENYGPRGRDQALSARVVTWQDGQAYLTTVARLQALNAARDLGGHRVARLPEHIAYADADAALLEALVLGLGVALLGGLMTWFVSGRISADLRGITAAVQAVHAKQTENTLPVLRSSAEVRVLSSSLHIMLERLLHVREDMEATIRQRTSELEAANYALAQQARTDALTGLLNRRGFEDQTRQVLAAARRGRFPLCVIMFDVDHFKRINDTLGHDVGDLVLKQLATTLRQRLRGSDVLARYGGEEFVALLPDTDLQGARAIAEAMVRAVAQEEHAPYGRITISAGVAAGLHDTLDMNELLHRADAALYEAKGQGRNRVCLDPASVQQASSP